MRNLVTKQVFINRSDASSWIYENANTGKIIYRNKIDTLIGTPHPGIVLGEDIWGTVWIIHNHYRNGKVEIDPLESFSEGIEVFYDSRPILYSTSDIIARAIQHYFQKKEYHWLTHNCQHFINNVTQGSHYSETVDRVSDNVMLIGGATTIVGFLINDKACIRTGLAITGVGSLGKGISRYTPSN